MQTISHDQLEKKRSSINDLTMINTLPQENFEQTKIPGSINVPQTSDDFVDRVSAAVMNNKQAEVVVYCASDQCNSSEHAAKKLDQAGFKNVYDFEGGYQDWKKAHQTA